MFDKAWLTSVLPLINDREQSVVQLASKLVLVSSVFISLNFLSPAEVLLWNIRIFCLGNHFYIYFD